MNSLVRVKRVVVTLVQTRPHFLSARRISFTQRIKKKVRTPTYFNPYNHGTCALNNEIVSFNCIHAIPTSKRQMFFLFITLHVFCQHIEVKERELRKE